VTKGAVGAFLALISSVKTFPDFHLELKINATTEAIAVARETGSNSRFSFLLRIGRRNPAIARYNDLSIYHGVFAALSFTS
jgi:hypothetical protein